MTILGKSKKIIQNLGSWGNSIINYHLDFLILSSIQLFKHYIDFDL